MQAYLVFTGLSSWLYPKSLYFFHVSIPPTEFSNPHAPILEQANPIGARPRQLGTFGTTSTLLSIFYLSLQ